MSMLALASVTYHPAPVLQPVPRFSYSRHQPICSKTQVFSPAYDGVTQRYAAADWAKNLRSLPNSMILSRISSPLLFNMLITILTCALNSSPMFARSTMSFSRTPHTLAGNALGLLLVFRTNAAYDRFWEARKVWGTVTSECRQLASLACTFMSPQQALPFLSLVAAFPVAMKSYLRATRDQSDRRRLRALLQQEEYEALINVINRPQYVLTRLRQLAWSSNVAGVTEKEREMLLKSVGLLGDCVCTCERIFNVRGGMEPARPMGELNARAVFANATHSPPAPLPFTLYSRPPAVPFAIGRRPPSRSPTRATRRASSFSICRRFLSRLWVRSGGAQFPSWPSSAGRFSAFSRSAISSRSLLRAPRMRQGGLCCLSQRFAAPFAVTCARSRNMRRTQRATRCLRLNALRGPALKRTRTASRS